jgi:hypothetical protein
MTDDELYYQSSLLPAERRKELRTPIFVVGLLFGLVIVVNNLASGDAIQGVFAGLSVLALTVVFYLIFRSNTGSVAVYGVVFVLSVGALFALVYATATGVVTGFPIMALLGILFTMLGSLAATGGLACATYARPTLSVDQGRIKATHALGETYEIHPDHVTKRSLFDSESETPIADYAVVLRSGPDGGRLSLGYNYPLLQSLSADDEPMLFPEVYVDASPQIVELVADKAAEDGTMTMRIVPNDPEACLEAIERTLR